MYANIRELLDLRDFLFELSARGVKLRAISTNRYNIPTDLETLILSFTETSVYFARKNSGLRFSKEHSLFVLLFFFLALYIIFLLHLTREHALCKKRYTCFTKKYG